MNSKYIEKKFNTYIQQCILSIAKHSNNYFTHNNQNDFHNNNYLELIEYDIKTLLNSLEILYSQNRLNLINILSSNKSINNKNNINITHISDLYNLNINDNNNTDYINNNLNNDITNNINNNNNDNNNDNDNELEEENEEENEEEIITEKEILDDINIELEYLELYQNNSKLLGLDNSIEKQIKIDLPPKIISNNIKQINLI